MTNDIFVSRKRERPDAWVKYDTKGWHWVRILSWDHLTSCNDRIAGAISYRDTRPNTGETCCHRCIANEDAAKATKETTTT